MVSGKKFDDNKSSLKPQNWTIFGGALFESFSHYIFVTKLDRDMTQTYYVLLEDSALSNFTLDKFSLYAKQKIDVVVSFTGNK